MGNWGFRGEKLGFKVRGFGKRETLKEERERRSTLLRKLGEI